jgi:hypothetical protein
MLQYFNGIDMSPIFLCKVFMVDLKVSATLSSFHDSALHCKQENFSGTSTGGSLALAMCCASRTNSFRSMMYLFFSLCPRQGPSTRDCALFGWLFSPTPLVPPPGC